MSGCATLLAYAAPALAANATMEGQIIIGILLVGNLAALATATYFTAALRMKGKNCNGFGPGRTTF